MHLPDGERELLLTSAVFDGVATSRQRRPPKVIVTNERTKEPYVKGKAEANSTKVKNKYLQQRKLPIGMYIY